MATKNDITGDSITSKITTQEYRDGHERIFSKKPWRYWATFEGLDYTTMKFDTTNLNDGDQISYAEFLERMKM